MHRFYPKFFVSALLCQQCTKIKFSGHESMQRDIRQENRMNTLTISEGQKMYLKFFKNTYQD
jgi:hypothetical protein